MLYDGLSPAWALYDNAILLFKMLYLGAIIFGIGMISYGFTWIQFDL